MEKITSEPNDKSVGMICNKEQVDQSLRLYCELLDKVSEFEKEIKDLNRHFTLDGHLVGSIGEVVASYHYNIGLSKASQKTYDGLYINEKNGTKIEVQIKITQQDSIVLHEVPEHLIALYLRKDGTVYEIYNGSGDIDYIKKKKKDGYGNRHLSILQLMEANKREESNSKINPKHPLKLMKKEYRN